MFLIASGADVTKLG